MSASAYETILEHLRALDAPEPAKEAFRQLIQQTLVTDSPPSSERVLFARHLLNLREPRNIIRQRLIDRFQVSRSQAYRDIDEALQIVPS